MTASPKCHRKSRYDEGGLSTKGQTQRAGMVKGLSWHIPHATQLPWVQNHRREEIILLLSSLHSQAKNTKLFWRSKYPSHLTRLYKLGNGYCGLHSNNEERSLDNNGICHPSCCLSPASGYTGSLKPIVTWRERNQAQRLKPCLDRTRLSKLGQCTHKGEQPQQSLICSHSNSWKPRPRPSDTTAALPCSAGKGSGSFHKKTYWIQDKLKHYGHSRFFHPWG